MFFTQWFRPANKKPDDIVIKREDYEALLQRLKKLEDMMDNLTQQSIPPPPPLPPPINENQPNAYRHSNDNADVSANQRDTNVEEKTDNIDEPKCKVREHYVVPFQNELEIRLKMIRKRMGTSHGWNDMPLDNVGDLENLEKSVIEKSIIIGNDKNNTRTTSENTSKLPDVQQFRCRNCTNVIIYDNYV